MNDSNLSINWKNKTEILQNVFILTEVNHQSVMLIEVESRTLLIFNFIILTIFMCNTNLLHIIQSNLAIPTTGFRVTLLITSVFQSPDFLHMI